MLVCHCAVVNDRSICAHIAEGVRTVEEVIARCGAGARCGGCRPAIESLLVNATASLIELPAGRRARTVLASGPAAR